MIPLLVLILLGVGVMVLSEPEAASADSDAAKKVVRQTTYDAPPRDSQEAKGRLAVLLWERPDASPHEWDAYGGKVYMVVDRPSGGKPWTYSSSGWPAADWTKGDWKKSVEYIEKKYGVLIDHLGNPGSPIDAYGRPVHGVSGDPLGVALAAAGIALPFVPGVGPAAAAALAAAIAIAKGESLKDAALKAARAAVPGGAAGQLAFDVGVAVASGQPVDQAAKDALLEQVPGGKEAYEQGQAAWDMAKGIQTGKGWY